MQKSDTDRRRLEAVHQLFNNRALRKGLLALRLPLALGVVAVVALYAKAEFFVAGLTVSAAGELVQVWCFAALKKQKILAVKGPYVFVRNPMYIGRYFLILGGVLLTGSLWAILAFSVLYYFYMVNRVKREEALLRNIFGEAYERYCREVNAFLPTFRNVKWKEALFFRWDLFFRNHAHWNVLAAVLAYIVFYLAAFGRA